MKRIDAWGGKCWLKMAAFLRWNWPNGLVEALERVGRELRVDGDDDLIYKDESSGGSGKGIDSTAASASGDASCGHRGGHTR